MAIEVVRDIRYRADDGPRGEGDLFLPAGGVARGSPVLLIHGGGWDALTKESLEPLAVLMAGWGRAVFNVNYRLLQHAPWPANRDDCVSAGRFMLDGGLARHGLAAARVVVMGASAGGHLAMVTGLGLPADRVESIVSMAGPSRLKVPGPDVIPPSSSAVLCSDAFVHRFFGMTEVSAAQVAEASPVLMVKSGAPRLWCIHSRNDPLVPLWHSQQAVAAWRRVGSQADVLEFDGPGDSHGFWDSEDRSIRQPIPAVVECLRRVVG